jgi:hypothetical protein
MSDDIEQGTLEQEVLPPGYPTWRRAHLFASWTVAVVGLAHCVVTAFVVRAWDESAVWLLGTGIGVLFVGTFVACGAAAVVAVPQPQAIVLVAALAVQAVASRVTLPGPG